MVAKTISAAKPYAIFPIFIPNNRINIKVSSENIEVKQQLKKNINFVI